MSAETTSVRATASGVMPGTDSLSSARRLEEELAGHLPPLVELPARGHHGSLRGRAVAMLAELHAELTSYGWRLTSGPAADHTRAQQLLRADVDTLADVRGARAEQDSPGASGEVLLHVLGPISLAAQLALANGEKVLADHGARRDLAESLAAGAQSHLEHVRRSCAPTSMRVVVLEPDLPRVRAGTVPTISGYQTLRALARDESRNLLGRFTQALQSAGADEVILDLDAAPQAEHVEDFRSPSAPYVHGFGLPLPQLDSQDWERAAELVEQGTRFHAALLPRVPASARQLPEVSALTAWITEPWRRLGMPLASLSAMTLTPVTTSSRERLAQVSEADALRLISRVRGTAEALSDQMQG